MHTNPAGGEEHGSALRVFAHRRFTYYPNRSLVLPLVTKLGRVMENQDGILSGRQTLSGGLKMPSQNLLLIHSRVGKESVRRLGVGPVLTRPGNTLPHSLRQLLHQPAKPLSQSHIPKLALQQLLINPAIGATKLLCSPFFLAFQMFLLLPHRGQFTSSR